LRPALMIGVIGSAMGGVFLLRSPVKTVSEVTATTTLA